MVTRRHRAKPIPDYLINFTTSELNTPIFRVFNIQRFLEMCGAKKNTLVLPKKWDDPFENFILTKALELRQATTPVPAQQKFYGQCWTKLRESDAMWRIYSGDKNGLKVRTTVGKLIKSLQAVLDGGAKCFIGRVSYLEDDVLRGNLESIPWLLSEVKNPVSMANSLLFKRKEFEHEHEVRLLYHTPATSTEEVFSYEIDPLKLFGEVQFDPRISKELFEVYKHYLTSEIGFKASVINRSELYQLPILKLHA